MRRLKIVGKQKRSLRVIVTTLSVVALIILSSGVKESIQPAIAQRVVPATRSTSVRISDVWQQVYQQLPYLPQENQYVNKQTRQVDSDNNLVNRLVRYHVYVKGRPPNYRLDWKLTLADYLDTNELMEEKRYPGYDTLRQNPIEGDRAAIKRLNRKQRDALVQALVNIFNPNYSATPAPAPGNSPQPSTAPSPGLKKETRAQGDKGTRAQGHKGTRAQGVLF